jgi:hypothetical protein
VTEFEQEHQGEVCLSVIMLAFPSEWAFELLANHWFSHKDSEV